MKVYTIKVHTIKEDGLPPDDLEQANLVGRVVFLFDGSLYTGWPLERNEGNPTETVWEDSETAMKYRGIEKWIELPVPGWDL